jgi:oligopeptide transport system substrate-binding protein
MVIFIPLPDILRLQKENKISLSPYLGVYFVGFENKKKPFDDPRVRRAFSLAIDRKQITEALLRGGQKPAYGLVPPGVTINGKDYRATTGDQFKEDAAEAKRLLAEAGFPGGKGLPLVKYLYNDMEQHRTVAQALQSMWQTTLGAKVDLEVQEWKVYLQNRQHHNYQSARGGWIADYIDPVTFYDMFATNSGNNDFEYHHADFDKLLEECKTTTDTVARMSKLQTAEHKLIADDMVIAPVFFYVNQYLIKPYVKGVALTPLGGIYFSGASIEGKK